jgi:hypothetical protein
MNDPSVQVLARESENALPGGSASLARVATVYQGSDGDATKALYDDLTKMGPLGFIATNLFRAQKSSSRAKVYRGGVRGKGSYRGMAYDRKQWAMDNLARALSEHANGCGLTWGWGADRDQAKHNIILYIELPTGQVSFHTEARGSGPEFPGRWDGARGQSPDRIIRFCARLLDGR